MRVSEKELEMLQQQADKAGLSVAQFVKREILRDSSFQESWELLLAKVQGLPPNLRFTVPMVYGEEWQALERGAKLSLGRAFQKQARNGEIPGVKALEPDSQRTMWYLRT